MIALIRIHGMIKLNGDVSETLSRLRLRKKKVKDFIAFGKIDEKTLAELIKARGKVIGNTKKKVENPEKIAKEVLAGKNLEELGIKPWFGLHPARGGIDTKHHYPKGVLGNHHEDINKLIARML